MTLIAVSFAVTVSCVFFLGLFVGKKNASLHGPREDRVARIPVGDYAKYAPPPAAAPRVAPAAASEPAEPPPASRAAATAAATGPATGDHSAAAARPGTPAEPAKDAAKSTPAKPEPEAKEEEPEERSTGRGYTVQVLATRRQGEADALVGKLKARGYNAYIKKVSEGAAAWYRVRVGSYGGFSDARAMADRCRRDLGLEQAFVSTE